jgi:hypothetical protein
VPKCAKLLEIASEIPLLYLVAKSLFEERPLRKKIKANANNPLRKNSTVYLE